MEDPVDPTQAIWKSVLTQLTADERITPALHGFISLVEPRGIMAGTLYLEEIGRASCRERVCQYV